METSTSVKDIPIAALGEANQWMATIADAAGEDSRPGFKNHRVSASELERLYDAAGYHDGTKILALADKVGVPVDGGNAGRLLDATLKEVRSLEGSAFPVLRGSVGRFFGKAQNIALAMVLVPVIVAIKLSGGLNFTLDGKG